MKLHQTTDFMPYQAEKKTEESGEWKYTTNRKPHCYNESESKTRKSTAQGTVRTSNYSESKTRKNAKGEGL